MSEERNENYNKLSPCPFCKDKAVLIKHEVLSNGFLGYYVYHSSFKCVCPEIKTRIYDSEEDAIADWNYRA